MTNQRPIDSVPLAFQQPSARGSREVAVPEPDSDVTAIFDFALTFDGYGKFGFERVAEVANAHKQTWDESGQISDDIEELRTALFFEQRRWRHFGRTTPADEAVYVREVLERLGEVADGFVEDQRPIVL